MWPQCAICGKKLSSQGVWRNWRRGPTTYPQVRTDGRRQEVAVRFLCRRCEERAARHRMSDPGMIPE